MTRALNILEFHRFCLNDPATALYRRAILERVRPGDVVLDIGAGSGSLSFFACQAGAARVYAVELDGSLELARVLAEHNGYADRVVLLRADAKQVQLPERADVLVTNTLETFGLNGGLLELVVDARERLLRPGAAVLPRSLGLYCAPLELPEFYERRIAFWQHPVHGLDAAPLHRFAVNNMYALMAERAACLADPAQLAAIDLATAQRAAVCGEAQFRVARAGTLHGLLGWFTAGLTPEIQLSNAPGSATTGYNQAFLPLARPLAVAPGDTLRIVLSTYNGTQWRWQVACERQAAPGAAERFEHTTFWGFPLSQEQLQPLEALDC